MAQIRWDKLFPCPGTGRRRDHVRLELKGDRSNRNLVRRAAIPISGFLGVEHRIVRNLLRLMPLDSLESGLIDVFDRSVSAALLLIPSLAIYTNFLRGQLALE